MAIFVANFAYEPNRTALRFLLEDVLPCVWDQLPDARLVLVGAGLEQPPSADSRVLPLGFVEDLAGAYAQARCAVVPLLHGGGSPLKLIEAFAYGLPVIATPRAVAGLDVHEGMDCLVAEGAEAFAATLVQVLRDGAWRSLRRARPSRAARSRPWQHFCAPDALPRPKPSPWSPQRCRKPSKRTRPELDGTEELIANAESRGGPFVKSTIAAPDKGTLVARRVHKARVSRRQARLPKERQAAWQRFTPSPSGLGLSRPSYCW